MEIGRHYFTAPNLISEKGTLEEALGLGDFTGRYAPLQFSGMRGIYAGISRIQGAYSPFDPQRSLLYDALKPSRSAPDIPFLNAPITLKDVRFRQQVVRELAERDDLYNAVSQLLTLMDVSVSFNRINPSLGFATGVISATPEYVADILTVCTNLETLQPRSKALRRMSRWARRTLGDTLVQELVKKKRKLTDGRLIAYYDECYGGVKYGVLKSGVDFDAVFDTLEVTEHVPVPASPEERRRTKKPRCVVKYETDEDESLVRLAVGRGRQRMDVLNELTAQHLSVPLFLTFAQLYQSFNAARLHRAAVTKGYDMAFPHISDTPHTLALRDILPVRLVLRDILGAESSASEILQPNSIRMKRDDLLWLIEGPNSRGKSELWRSLYLALTIANMGGSLPAHYALISPVREAHFISCKGTSGRGGSEFARSWNNIGAELREIRPGDTVILDEIGDSTNAPTARAFARRLVPALTKRGCRVLMTSQHDAVTSYVEESGGTVLTPDPRGKQQQRFRIVRKRRQVDYRPEETLAVIGCTERSIEDLLGSRESTRRGAQPAIEEDSFFRDDEDQPF